MKGRMILFDETTKEMIGEMKFHKTNDVYTSEVVFKFPRPTWVDIFKSTVKYVGSAAATLVLVKVLK